MGVALVEIQTAVDSRSVTKKATGEVFEFHTQTAYLHGQEGSYPQPFSISYNAARDALAPGWYVFTGTAFQLKDNRLELRLGRDAQKHLVPVADALRDMQARVPSLKAA